GTAAMPMWRLLALGAAVLPVLGMHSRLADLEAVATRRLCRFQRAYLAGTALACLVIYLGVSAIAVPLTILVTMVRSWLGWFGLALVAGVILGWWLAWTLPALISTILIYWGYQGGGGYEWVGVQRATTRRRAEPPCECDTVRDRVGRVLADSMAAATARALATMITGDSPAEPAVVPRARTATGR